MEKVYEFWPNLVTKVVRKDGQAMTVEDLAALKEHYEAKCKNSSPMAANAS